MSSLQEYAGDVPIGLTVCNGGYIVHAQVPTPEDPEVWRWETAIFTDTKSLMAYLQRVIHDQEGPLKKDYDLRSLKKC